jgi:hypothetical protein
VVGGGRASLPFGGFRDGRRCENGCLHADSPPGRHKTGASPKPAEDFDAGQMRFVRMVSQFGVIAWHFRSELVDDMKGRRNIAMPYYTGK